jgi:hypothetical protein
MVKHGTACRLSLSRARLVPWPVPHRPAAGRRVAEHRHMPSRATCPLLGRPCRAAVVPGAVGGTIWCARRWGGTGQVLNAASADELAEYLAGAASE